MDATATEVTVTVQLSRGTLFRAILEKQIRSWTYWITPLLIAAALLLNLRHNPFAAITAPFAVMLFLLAMPYNATRASLKNPGLRDPITYTFNDLTVTAKFSNGENRADWSLVTGAFETSNYLFVLMQRGSFHLIPKQQIDEFQLHSLRQLLRHQLGPKARRLR
ncbi:MAG TPA: YcxB family protein [Bryobacteraceae bacterium]|jgi:hypothetical protein|nr:YcxB family protein [Bryobacteraceae bacterium]